jgi:hypothetical protein
MNGLEGQRPIDAASSACGFFQQGIRLVYGLAYVTGYALSFESRVS